MRDHGGDLDRARATYGGADWIDLSTGINPVPYPMPDLPHHAIAALPTAQDIAALEGAAARAYGTGAQVAALAGAQGAIQLVPRLRPVRRAAVLSPSYNEHAASLSAQGWEVEAVASPTDMAGADLAVVVNPNNPDGRCWTPEEMAALADRVGLLVVDESFADPHPELSLAPRLAHMGERAIVLRSFGKFYGLAGLRLGFAIGGTETVAAIRALAGPWAVSGPAIVAGTAALTDATWRAACCARLADDSARLDALAVAAGWGLVGGTALFRTYDAGNARAAQERLARAAIWTRIFPYSDGWIRLGLPGSEAAWQRLRAALPGAT
ncbi:L-threonine 3-O-phosphate decarboxylase [Roseibacterium elongatum DSM 19469]|uniref:threonine-phosphate decarboxylase n=1 Tax=Roseicyclus elongatus DSM 19469 TaxID=1294273 RepID=W8S2W6_9RHOB|nr:threonine-phosphate decarboxylase CobD [Roseibacterium elongatum]AHM04527.1 L-threonine 3-O-phosphate decarboxylase [Roseibacterium elongatum DSM 19469]